MPETGEDSDRQARGGSLLTKAVWLAGFAALAAALTYYMRLIGKVDGRTEVFNFYFRSMLPIAAGHTALFLLLTLGLKFRARGALIFWALSAGCVLAFGSFMNAGALVMMLGFAFVLSLVGETVAGRLFLPDTRSWWISLAFGILLLSAAGAFLASIYLFKWWVLALLIVLFLARQARGQSAAAPSRYMAGWNGFSETWSVGRGLMLQGFFLLGVYAYIQAAVPETSSDALRFYWPYMKLLRFHSGFFDVPQQWSYIIPQAGITYSAAVFSLFGKYAARLPMLLAWATLIGIVCHRRRPGLHPDAPCAVALVVASAPAVMWVATSLMQDSFVALSVMVLAVLCVEGAEPGSLKYWAAAGACVGMAWSAKYSTLAYAAPLMLFAAIRSCRAAGWGRTLRGLVLAGFSALVIAGPWLVHSYRQCRNPVFPLFLSIFPSPLWPRGVGFSNLDTFSLAPGWRGWLASLGDMTFHTHRFVEGFDGLIGLALLILAVLGVAALCKGTPAVRALAFCSMAGTALLWSQTGYLRYWLPGLWLAALAAGQFMEPEGARWPATRFLIAGAAIAVMLPHVLLTMLNYWPDPKGLPWAAYSGKINWQNYLDRHFRGFEEVERLSIFGRQWPKVWFTGFDAAGYLQVQPMEATVWELSLHANEPRSKIGYLCSAGCEYWIVNEDGDDAYWVKAIGISQFFWNEANLVARSGPVSIYRMPGADQTLVQFDARSVSGTDLVMDGGFEIGKDQKLRFWRPKGTVDWVFPSTVALQGRGAVRLSPGAVLRQDVALPPGVGALEFTASARTCPGCRPVSLRYQLTVSGFQRDLVPGRPEDWIEPYQFLSGKKDVISAGEAWERYSTAIVLPPRAKYVTIEIERPENAGEAFVDEVRLYSR